MAERLEERSLMAADLGFHSELWNVVKPSDVNADGVVTPSDALVVINSLNSQGTITVGQLGGEGESGASTKYFMDVNNDGTVSPADALTVINELNGEGEGPPVALYTVDEVADANSTTPISSVRGGQDFYVRVRARDLRSPALNPAGVYAAYMDLLYDTNLFTVAINEVQSITLPDFTPNGSFTLSKDGGVTKTAPINFDTSDSSVSQEAAIQTALNNYLPNPVTVKQDALNPVRYVVTFGSNKDINVDQPQLNAFDVQPAGKSVTTSTVTQGDPAAAGVVDEIQTISLPASTTGTFTLTNNNGTTTTAPINFDTTGVASQAAAIKTALDAYLAHPVKVDRSGQNPNNYTVTFNDPADSNKPQPLLKSLDNQAVTTFESAKGGAGFSLAIQYSDGSKNIRANYSNGKSGSLASDRFDELGSFFSGNTSPGGGAGVGSVEVLRIHMLAKTPSGATQTAFTPILDNPDSTSALLSPAHDTLMLGQNSAVPHSQITLSFTTLTVTSGPINANPDPGTGNPAITVNEDTAAGVTINVIANDTKNTGAPAGNIQLVPSQTFTVSPAGAGTVTAVDANNVKFVPAANFNGTATFTYKAQIAGDSNPDDVSTGTVTVTVNAVNDAPVVTAPATQSPQEDVALAIGGVSVADVDADASGRAWR